MKNETAATTDSHGCNNTSLSGASIIPLLVRKIGLAGFLESPLKELVFSIYGESRSGATVEPWNCDGPKNEFHDRPQG